MEEQLRVPVQRAEEELNAQPSNAISKLQRHEKMMEEITDSMVVAIQQLQKTSDKYEELAKAYEELLIAVESQMLLRNDVLDEDKVIRMEGTFVDTAIQTDLPQNSVFGKRRRKGRRQEKRRKTKEILESSAPEVKHGLIELQEQDEIYPRELWKTESQKSLASTEEVVKDEIDNSRAELWELLQTDDAQDNQRSENTIRYLSEAVRSSKNQTLSSTDELVEYLNNYFNVREEKLIKQTPKKSDHCQNVIEEDAAKINMKLSTLSLSPGKTIDLILNEEEVIQRGYISQYISRSNLL